MDYYSILYEQAIDRRALNKQMPMCFTDLNLDQVINAITDGKDEYELKELFYTSIKSKHTISYRNDIFRDLENAELYDSLKSFSFKMKKMREYLRFNRELHTKTQCDKWFFDAVSLYCNAVNSLYNALRKLQLRSNGFRMFIDWLRSYISSDIFTSTQSSLSALQHAFDQVKYGIRFDQGKIVVCTDDTETDYGKSLTNAFERLLGITYSTEIKVFKELEMNILEKRILEIVRCMYPDTFAMLETFCAEHMDFCNDTVIAFDREIQFYLSYIEYINPLKAKGHPFAYPIMNDNTQTVQSNINVTSGYDLALAHKHAHDETDVVCNDFRLNGHERIFVCTGPNQGGKTTFARTFGQIIYLSTLGCPTPCERASMFIFDEIYTHFIVEEDINTHSGRLGEELKRMHVLMSQITPNSVIILNELFASTTTYDGYILGQRILNKILNIGCICLYVTHIYELADIDERAVSIVAEVKNDSGHERTFRIVRKPADGEVYTNRLVESLGLTYACLKERLQ